MGDSKNIITPGAILGRCEPAIRLHVVAGHNLIGFRDEAIELLLVPYKIRALHSAGIAVVRKRTGFPSDDIVEVRAQAIVAFLWSYGRRCLEGKRSRKKPPDAPTLSQVTHQARRGSKRRCVSAKLTARTPRRSGHRQ